MCEVELIGLTVEIMMRGSTQAVDPIAEVDARQIAREDLLLGQPRLEPESDDDFLRLALDRSVAGQEVGLGELLGDRASALLHPAAAHIGDERPRHSAWVDSPVPVKAAVLDRDERSGRQGIELGYVHGRFLDRAAQRDWTAIVTFQEERGIGERLERARQRRRDDKPQDRHRQQRRDTVEDERPAAAALWLFGPVGLVAIRRALGGKRIGQFLDRLPVTSPDRIPLCHSHLNSGLALAALLQ